MRSLFTGSYRTLYNSDVSSYIPPFIDVAEQFGEIEFDSHRFQVSVLMHPSTYLNKVLVGSRQGSLQLWNIRTW